MTERLANAGLAAITIALTASLLPCQSGIAILAAKDTTLYESATGALANGSGTSLFIGRSGGGSGGMARRALLQFDLTGAIPSGAVITGAVLELFVEQTSATAPTTTFVHRVTSPWQEGAAVAPGGGGAGGTAVAGESTWLHRDYPNVLWTNPGGDYDASPSLTFSLPTSGVVFSATSSNLVNDINSWLANPTSNFGWLLKTDETQPSTARRCSSSEATPSTTASVPKLWISYLNPGQTGLGGQSCPVAGSGTQRFNLGITTSPATGGSTVGLFYVTGPSNSIGASIFSLGFNPSGVQLFSGCSTFLLQPLVPGNVFLTDASGFASDSFTVPLNAPGFLVAVQGVAIDNSPSGFTLSNAGLMLTQ